MTKIKVVQDNLSADSPFRKGISKAQQNSNPRMTNQPADRLREQIDTALHPERNGLLLQRGIAEGASHEHLIVESLLELIAQHDAEMCEKAIAALPEKWESDSPFNVNRRLGYNEALDQATNVLKSIFGLESN